MDDALRLHYAMAARRTRATAAAERAARSPLSALADDAVGEIALALADPLRPAVAVALGSASQGLRTASSP